MSLKPFRWPQNTYDPLRTILNIHEIIPQIYSHDSRPTNTQQIVIALSLWPSRFSNSRTWTKPFVQWPITGPWTSILVPVSTRMIVKWTFGHHAMFPLLHDILQNPVCIGILLSHHHAHYTIAPIYQFCSSFLLTCFGIPLMYSPVSGQMMMDAVTLRGP